MSRKILLVILFSLRLLFCKAENGDTLIIPGSWSAGIKAQNGFIIAHRPSIVYLQNKNVSSIEISWLHSSTGNRNWEKMYNAPLYGFAYQYFDLGNSDILGNAHAVYPIVLFPLLHNKNHLALHIRFGLGIGYLTKRYTIKENHKNQAISTHINGAITTGLQFRVPFKGKTQISTGFDLTHFSNGATRLPNAGLNIATYNIGIQHFFGNPVPLAHDESKSYGKEKEISFYGSIGFKEKSPGTRPRISVGVFSADYHWRISYKSLLGGGADFFYDQTLQKRILDIDSLVLSQTAANSRAGIHASYGLIVGSFEGFFQTGYYLYNKFTVDASIYSKLSLRYFLNQSVFVCFNLKSHFAKADYFEYGIGYRSKSK